MLYSASEDSDLHLVDAVLYGVLGGLAGLTAFVVVVGIMHCPGRVVIKQRKPR